MNAYVWNNHNIAYVAVAEDETRAREYVTLEFLRTQPTIEKSTRFENMLKNSPVIIVPYSGALVLHTN